MVTTAWLRRATSYGIAAMMTFFGLTGVVSAQTITNTGPGSTNTISSNYTNNCSVTNSNTISAQNSNNQSATTGDANDSGNTSSGLAWTGWGALDPATAQAAGTGYNGWWSGVVNWVGQRASGAGWNSNQSNLSWMPGSSDWNSYNPVTWQSNGQSFGNWYNAVEAYLNGNSSAWVLSWPADATGAGTFGATSGDATNNYNANFSININNSARAAAGTDSCGRSKFTPPPSVGGMGGGPSASAPGVAGSSFAPRASGGSGSFGGAYYAPSDYYAPRSHPSSPVVVAAAPAAPSTPSAPVGGSGGGAPAPSSTISNTGPGSTNYISSNYTNNSAVTNDNNITICNTSSQDASSGDSNVSGNTGTGGGGTGDASNNNGTGGSVGIGN